MNHALGLAVKVLTVRQPHAWALVAGHKDIENRTRRGPEQGTVLAILAGLKYDPPLRVRVDEPEHFIHGAVIGTVTVQGSHLYDPAGCCDSSWALPQGGAWHWHVARAVMLDEPIPMRGSLALQSAPLPVQRAVERAHSRKGW